MNVDMSRFGAAVHYKIADMGWLLQHQETILEPDLPIIDPHHHLWDRHDTRYLLHDLLGDIYSGHNIVGTVFLECSAMFRKHGPLDMKPVGETEFVAGIAAMSESGQYGPAKIAAGIVPYADMLLGAKVRPVLEAHRVAAGGRLVGIRHMTVWDEDITVRMRQAPPKPLPVPGMLLDPKFQEGVRELARHDLTYDVWLFHHQLDELVALADACPDTRIILDHVGGVLRVGPYAGRDDEVFAQWSRGIEALAKRPNVYMKFGGLGMTLCGFDYPARPVPPSSKELARDWKPYFDRCIESLGPERTMFESNFPVDKGSFSYAVNWNAFKRLAVGFTAAEKNALFHATAKKVYGLKIDIDGAQS